MPKKIDPAEKRVRIGLTLAPDVAAILNEHGRGKERACFSCGGFGKKVGGDEHLTAVVDCPMCSGSGTVADARPTRTQIIEEAVREWSGRRSGREPYLEGDLEKFFGCDPGARHADEVDDDPASTGSRTHEPPDRQCYAVGNVWTHFYSSDDGPCQCGAKAKYPDDSTGSRTHEPADLRADVIAGGEKARAGLAAVKGAIPDFPTEQQVEQAVADRAGRKSTTRYRERKPRKVALAKSVKATLPKELAEAILGAGGMEAVERLAESGRGKATVETQPTAGRKKARVVEVGAIETGLVESMTMDLDANNFTATARPLARKTVQPLPKPGKAR